MGEVVNPALAGIRTAEQTRISDLRAKADAWSARNDLRNYSGSLRDLASLVPGFERRSMRSDNAGKSGPRLIESDHSHLDVVLRRAGPGVGLLEVPVGTVNRRYQLLPHARVIENLDSALGVIRVDPVSVPAQLDLTGFGARMALSVELPASFDFDPGDREPLGLRILVNNSVNGGGLRLLAAWQEHRSDSAFAVGVTRLESRLAHRLPARLADIVPGVQRALELAQAERNVLFQWRAHLVTRDQLVEWVDGSVRRMWGWKAAARLFHIAMTGWDAVPAFAAERGAPSRRTMQASDPVPGAPAFTESAYDALLALGWIAREGRDPGEHFDRMVETALLMRALLGGNIKK